MIDAAILCGGLGTRLQSVVADRPKALAPVAGRPFLAHLLNQLIEAGLKRVVLCTGYKGELVHVTFGDTYSGLALEYSREPEPLGTGGGLRYALPLLQSETALVMNGDSFFAADLAGLLQIHNEKNAEATMALAAVDDTSRYGRVTIGESGAVTAFQEKGAAQGPGLMNAGIYLVRKSMIESIPQDRPISLERDVFPGLASKGLYGVKGNGRFIDIGTPESFALAESFFQT